MKKKIEVLLILCTFMPIAKELSGHVPSGGSKKKGFSAGVKKLSNVLLCPK